MGMNSNSKKLVDPRTHINMTRLLLQLQARRQTRYSQPPPYVKMKPLETAHVPPVLLPTFTKSQFIILDDIEETLAGF